MVAQGLTYRHVALVLGVTHHTIREHLRRVHRKYGEDWETPQQTARRLYWVYLR